MVPRSASFAGTCQQEIQIVTAVSGRRPEPCLLHVCSYVVVKPGHARASAGKELRKLRVSRQRASVNVLVLCGNRTPEQRTLNPRARRPSYRLPCVNPDDYCLRLVMRCLTGGSTARPPARPEVCSARTPLPVSHPGGGASGHRRGDSPARWRSPGRPPAGTSTARARAGRRRTSGPNAPPIPARRATRCPRKGTKRAWIGRASGYTHR